MRSDGLCIIQDTSLARRHTYFHHFFFTTLPTILFPPIAPPLYYTNFVLLPWHPTSTSALTPFLLMNKVGEANTPILLSAARLSLVTLLARLVSSSFLHLPCLPAIVLSLTLSRLAVFFYFYFRFLLFYAFRFQPIPFLKILSLALSFPMLVLSPLSSFISLLLPGYRFFHLPSHFFGLSRFYNHFTSQLLLPIHHRIISHLLVVIVLEIWL